MAGSRGLQLQCQIPSLNRPFSGTVFLYCDDELPCFCGEPYMICGWRGVVDQFNNANAAEKEMRAQETRGGMIFA